MSVRAKFVCTNKTLSAYRLNDGSTVTAAGLTFRAVYPQVPPKTPGQGCYSYDEKTQENKIFGDATPSADCHMFVVNQAAHDQFVEGKEYIVHFEDAEKWHAVMDAPKASG